MGTNYYHHTKVCDCCGRFDVEHIGKSSGGWQFSFHATEDARSWQDWQRLLPEGKIYNEYDEAISFEAFVELVTKKQEHGVSNHARDYPGMGNYVDAEGYSFSPYEFS